MRIVQQLAPVSHSSLLPLPLLAAPKIAGLLPAPIPQTPPKLEPFVFADPRLNNLSESQRAKLFVAGETLFNTAIAFALDELNLHALNTALVVFRRALTDEPVRATTPAQYRAEREATIMEWMVNSERRRASREKQITLEVEALRNATGTVYHA